MDIVIFGHPQPNSHKRTSELQEENIYEAPQSIYSAMQFVKTHNVKLRELIENMYKNIVEEGSISNRDKLLRKV